MEWFEFIHYSILVNNTCVLTMPLYAHIIAIKDGCLLHIFYSLFVLDSWDIRRLRCAMLEFISATFLWRNTS